VTIEYPSQPHRASDLGVDFVAVPDPDVEMVAVESEALLYYPERDVRVALNANAALIWTVLDSESSVGEIAADLAEHFSVPFETMVADVSAAVLDFHARGMVYDAREPRTAPAHAEVAIARRLAASDFPLGDDGIVAVQVGNEVIGVRSNDADALALLRGALSPVVVNQPSAIPRLSLLVTPDRGRIAGLSFLYRDDELVFRSASRGRALRATLAHVDAFLPAPATTIRLDAHVLVGTRGAVLVGGEFLEMLELAGRRLAARGWQVVDGPGAVVDRDAFSALVEPPRLALDPAGMAEIDAQYPPGPDELTRHGHHGITTVIVVGSEPYPATPASPAQRLAVLLPLVSGSGRVERSDVEWLNLLSGHVGDIRWLSDTDDEALVATLGALAGHRARPARPLPR
jgi:hypothetical protein